MLALKSAAALRPVIARIAQKNNVIVLASRDMTVLSKKSGEEYRKQVSTLNFHSYLLPVIEYSRMQFYILRHAVAYDNSCNQPIDNTADCFYKEFKNSTWIPFISFHPLET